MSLQDTYSRTGRHVQTDEVISGARKPRQGKGPVARRHAPAAGRRLRLLVLAHANRAAGGRAVGLQLLESLVQMDDEVDVMAVLPTGCGYEALAETGKLRAVWFRQNGSFTRRFLFDVFGLPRGARALRPDAIIGLGNIGLLNPPVPQVILVHDAHYVYPRRHHGPMTLVQHMRYVVQMCQIRRCLARSCIVYCQTATMLQRVRSVLGGPPRAELLPNCIPAFAEGDGDLSLPPSLAPYADRFRLICLSRYYPHKNLEGIVEMFRRNRGELKDAVVFLTITAAQHPNARRLLDAVDRHHLSDRIVNLGPLGEREIPGYLRNCHALLFPTWMESFSATYLEAMALGLPIVTSDLDFARDVCGPAALYFDPWSSTSMKEAIVRTMRDTDLRQDLARAGRERLSTVHSRSWRDIAETVVSDLREVALGTGQRRLEVPAP